MLLTFAAGGTFFFVSIIALAIMVDYNESVARWQNELARLSNNSPAFAADTYGQYFGLPLLHLLTAFVFISLIAAKRFYVSTILTTLYAANFIYGLSGRYYATLLGGEEVSPPVSVLRIYRVANGFEYVAAFFIIVLLVWQFSILFRGLSRSKSNLNFQ